MDVSGALLPGGGARAVGDDVHCFECEEALLHQLHHEGHITFCAAGEGSDEMCGCAAPAGQEEHVCRATTAGAGVGESGVVRKAEFSMEDSDRDRLRRVFERAERDKRKEHEHNVKRGQKNAAPSPSEDG